MVELNSERRDVMGTLRTKIRFPLARSIAIIIVSFSSLTVVVAPQVATGAPREQRERLIVRAVERSAASPPSILQDLKSIAADLGLPLSEVMDRYAWQNNFTAAVDAIRAQYPESFAGARITGGPSAEARIEFTGDIPVGVDRMLSGVPVDVELLGAAPRNEKRMQSLVRAAHHAAQASTSSVVGTELAENGKLVVTVHGGTADDRSRGADVRAAAERAVAGAGVLVELMSAEPLVNGGSQVNVYGGGSLSSCTAGFTVRRTSGTEKGIVTAEHCADSQYYQGYSVLRYVNRLVPNTGDIQYMRITGATAGRYFYNDVGRLSAQTRFNTPVVGMAICKFGKTTGKDCTTVRDTFTCRGSYCNLVSTKDYVTEGGDSGGPWSYGTTVYGVHSGYHTSVFFRRSQFTPVYNTLSQLGVTIYNT